METNNTETNITNNEALQPKTNKKVYIVLIIIIAIVAFTIIKLKTNNLTNQTPKEEPVVLSEEDKQLNSDIDDIVNSDNEKDLQEIDSIFN